LVSKAELLIALLLGSTPRQNLQRIAGIKEHRTMVATKEEAFAELVREYENMWVAIIEVDGVEFVAGYGPTAVEAASEAAKKGHAQAMLFKVPSSKSRFVY